MANRFQKIIYYLSAGAPVLIVFAIVWLIEKSTWTDPIVICWKVPIVLLFISIILMILFALLFDKAKTSLSIVDVHGSEYKCVDGWNAGYIITFLLPFASFALGDVVWIVVTIVVLFLLAVLVFSDHITPHPLLFFCGYHFYELKVEGLASNYIVISKKQIRNVKDFKKVSRVFEFLLIRMV